MTIGVIVDGEAEAVSLSALFEKLATSNHILRPLKATASVNASTSKLVRALQVPCSVLCRRGAEAIVVLLDREKLQECSGSIASAIERAIARETWSSDFSWVKVVLKDRMFENWLIADVAALRTLHARFQFSQGILTRIESGLTDSVPALQALQTAALRHGYAKVADGRKIIGAAEPERMDTSRSFRKFLRVIGEPRYADQSRLRR